MHPSKSDSWIDVSLEESVIEVRLQQSLNACIPIKVTLSGIVMEVRLLQPEKASWNIQITQADS